MKNPPLEPGILKIFRIFLIIELILILDNVFAHYRHGILVGCPWSAIIFGIINILLLLGYISFPWFQKQFGRFFLPVALVYAAVFSLIEQNFFLNVRFSLTARSTEETAWQLFLFLFIPLVLISWQYNFRAVILYCIFTGFLDFVLIKHSNINIGIYPSNYGWLIYVRTMAFLVAGYMISHIMTQFREQRAALRQSNRELVHYASTLEQLTVSRERNRMARELHDTLAHTLSGIAVQLEAVQSLWKDDLDEAKMMLSKSLTTTRNGLTETRRAMQALRASPLEDIGLLLAVQNLAQAAAERAGFKINWQMPARIPKLAPDIEQGVYRIMQEVFENIVRHAEAKEVLVKGIVEENLIKLSIQDDGIGFSLSELNDDHHFGLQGVSERTQMIGGELELISQPSKGTTINLTVKVQDGKSIDM